MIFEWIESESMTFKFIATTVMASSALAFSGPQGRQVTEPKSITSIVEVKARPVSIKGLYTVNTVQAATWSPDGRRIAYIARSLSGL